MAYLTIEPDTKLREVNRSVEAIFDLPRANLLRRKLSDFLLRQSQWVLHGMLRPLLHGSTESTQGKLTVTRSGRGIRAVRAVATRDPEGDRYLLILSEVSGDVDLST